VRRPAEKPVRTVYLYNFSGIHNHRAVTNKPYRSQVVGNKKKAQLPFSLPPFKKVQNPTPGRYIQSGNRLVANKQFQFQHHGPRQAYALQLAQAELARIFPPFIIRDGRRLQQFPGPGQSLISAGCLFVNEQRLSHNLFSSHPGIEGARGVRKNHLHFAPVTQKIGAGEGQNIFPGKKYFAPGRTVKTHQHPGQGGFAAAAFTNQPQNLPPSDRKADAVNRF